MTIKKNIPTAAPMTVNDESDDSTVTLVDISHDQAVFNQLVSGVKTDGRKSN